MPYPVATKDKDLPSAKKSVEKISQIAEKEGLKAKTLTLRGTPYNVIVETAEKKNADVIVVGSHGRTGLFAKYGTPYLTKLYVMPSSLRLRRRRGYRSCSILSSTTVPRWSSPALLSGLSTSYNIPVPPRWMCRGVAV